MSTAQIESTHPKEVPMPQRSPAQVQPITRRSGWWVYAIILLVVAGFAWFIYHIITGAAAAKSADASKARALHDLPVVTAVVRRGDLDQYLIGLGTVTPLNTVTIKSRVDGAITKVYFTEGQVVNQGDPLLDIDPRPYDAALKQAQGQLAKDQATKDSADWNVSRDVMALKDNSISQQQIHTDTALRDQAAAAIQIDQAQIDTAQLNLTYAHITAPITGTIGLRLVDVGNIVHASDANGLAVIAQLQPITVVFNLPEDNIAQIQKRIASGQPMVVDAYDRDLTQKIASGTVLAIDNEIDPTTGTVKIKAVFDNKDNALFPSQFVNARLLVNTINAAVLVPSAAIQHSPTSTFVYKVVDDAAPASTDTPPKTTADETAAAPKPPSKKVVLAEVTVGATQAAIASEGEDTTEVISGLEPGDIVVTDGVDKLLDGAKVIPHPSARRGGTTRPSTTGPTTRPGGRRRRDSGAALTPKPE